MGLNFLRNWVLKSSAYFSKLNTLRFCYQFPLCQSSIIIHTVLEVSVQLYFGIFFPFVLLVLYFWLVRYFKLNYKIYIFELFDIFLINYIHIFELSSIIFYLIFLLTKIKQIYALSYYLSYNLIIALTFALLCGILNVTLNFLENLKQFKAVKFRILFKIYNLLKKIKENKKEKSHWQY